MSPEKIKELEKLISIWLVKEMIVSPGETVEIGVNIIHRPLVRVRVEREYPIDNMPITDLELSPRAVRQLRKANIERFRQMRTKTRKQLSDLEVSEKSLREVEDLLRRLDLLSSDWNSS